jgi:hypothetical protein
MSLTFLISTSCYRIRWAFLKLSFIYFYFYLSLGVAAVQHVEHVMTRANVYASTSGQEITACVPGCRNSLACWRELLPQLHHSAHTTLYGLLRYSLIIYMWCIHITYVYENAYVYVSHVPWCSQFDSWGFPQSPAAYCPSRNGVRSNSREVA